MNKAIKDIMESRRNICVKGLEVTVLKSAAGYYIGTVDDFGSPNCRISGYFPSREQATVALNNRSFSEREALENLYCNGGIGSCIH